MVFRQELFSHAALRNGQIDCHIQPFSTNFTGYGSEIIRITDNMNIFSGLSDLTVHVRPFSGSWSSLAGTPLDGIQLLNARQLWKVREFPFSVHMIQRMRKRPAQKR